MHNVPKITDNDAKKLSGRTTPLLAACALFRGQAVAAAVLRSPNGLPSFI